MIKKILFITLSNIGDVILTTPVLEYLHTKYPKAKIDIVGDLRSKEIFDACRYKNIFYIKDKSKGLIGNIKLINKLRQKEYDIAIDLRTDFYLFFIKANKKFFKRNNKNTHSALKHFSAIEDDLNKIPNTNIWIPEYIIEKVKNKIPKNAKKILCLGLGANSTHKIWPTSNYVELCYLLTNKFDTFILLGSKNEQQYSKIFKKGFNENVIDLCGYLTILESAAILKKANFFIGNDSGLGHIASATKTKSFTIFGDGSPLRYKPFSMESYFYQNHEKDINLIDVETIFEEIKKIKIL
jgi:heptosyltransferase-3